MAKNIVKVTVRFNSLLSMRIMNTPTFIQLFGRISEIRNKEALPDVEYGFNTNHSHKSQIERMYANFSCVEDISFTQTA